MRKMIAIAALAAALIGSAAPSFAEGTYVAGPTASQAWTGPEGRTLLAGTDGANFDQARQGG